ncbi:MAG: MarC family protein [Candidatus Omnitrophota bacterium]
MGIISGILVSFCALFTVLDPIGLLPAFKVLNQEMPAKESKKTLISSLYMAMGLVLVLLIACRIIAWLLGLATADFQIGGGIGLFVLSIYYLLKPEREKKLSPETVNIFPLAAPLIIGPSVLIMILVLMSSYGLIITSLSFAANMVLIYVIFRNANKIQASLGDNGVGLFSKTVGILLSVFAIMLIRKGLIALFMLTCANNL